MGRLGCLSVAALVALPLGAERGDLGVELLLCSSESLDDSGTRGGP